MIQYKAVQKSWTAYDIPKSILCNYTPANIAANINNKINIEILIHGGTNINEIKLRDSM